MPHIWRHFELKAKYTMNTFIIYEISNPGFDIYNAIYIIGEFSKRREATQTVSETLGNAECGRDVRALQKDCARPTYVLTSVATLFQKGASPQFTVTFQF